VEFAEERSQARAARRWGRADELRAAIEAAGWRVEDAGTTFRLFPALPPDLVIDGRHYYGSVASVPSRLDEPATARATVAVLVPDAADAPAGLLASLAAWPAGGPTGVTQIVAVAPYGTSLGEAWGEVVGTATPFSAGDALQAALRRASGAIVVVLAPGWSLGGDILSPLEAALADPEMAVAGTKGVASADLRRFHDTDARDVVALRSGCFAFRREDAARVGPVDGRLQLPDSAAIWLSLALRDRGPNEPPRHAVALELPLQRLSGEVDPAAPAASSSAEASAPDARSARRDGYRLADRFADRRWLATAETAEGRVEGIPAEGTQSDDEDDDGHQREDAAEP